MLQQAAAEPGRRLASLGVSQIGTNRKPGGRAEQGCVRSSTTVGIHTILAPLKRNEAVFDAKFSQ